MSLHGHLWTIVPDLTGRLVQPLVPSQPFITRVQDPQLGAIPLRGLLQEVEGARTAVLLVHGLGGGFDSPSLARASMESQRAGFSSLRIALRGADREGDDFYHAGLVDDLRATLEAPELAHYENLVVVGFSLGGHVSLRLALDPPPRVRAVAAVCAPLDLLAGVEFIDGRAGWLYRRHVLNGLLEMYEAVARRREVPTPLEEVRRTRTLRRWDELTVVPRFGFANPMAYYESQSVGPRLRELAVPALIVQATKDPMVPPHTVRRWLDPCPPSITLRWTPRGGHLGAPRDLDLGLPGPLGLMPQIYGWLRRLTA